jgi:pilus assembly protein CpaC
MHIINSAHLTGPGMAKVWRHVTAALLAGSVVAAGLTYPTVQAAAQSAAKTVRLASRGGETVTVAVGSTQTLRTPDSFVDLVVGDPAVADVMPLTNQSFYIHGKKRGTMTIAAYDPQRRLIGNVEVEVGFDIGKLQRELRRRLPQARIKVSSLNGSIELSGTVPDAPTVDRAMMFAKRFDPKAINSMEVAQPQQVMLEVRFIEASRNAARDLGINWRAAGKHFAAATAGMASSATPFGSFIGNILRGGVKVDVLINALEEKGLGRRLAEPNLIALSGQKASFLAGGEFPFPVAGSNNTVTIQFKKFGVGLVFTPTVLSNGVINLKIEPEVSQIDRTTSVSVGGIFVPSLVVRRADTTVQLRDGQSFAIAGLLQSESADNAKQLPWIGSVPVLGTLFRSAAYERKETDLAIIVTPRLVKPAAPNRKLRTPLDVTKPANDVDRFLLNRQEVTLAQARNSRGKAPYVAVGHILDLKGKR